MHSILVCSQLNVWALSFVLPNYLLCKGPLAHCTIGLIWAQAVKLEKNARRACYAVLSFCLKSIFGTRAYIASSRELGL